MKKRVMGKSIDSKTLLLAHFDGNFKDAVTGKEFASYGSGIPVLSYSEHKFGNGCATGIANYETPDFLYIENADIDYNITKEITIDMWIKCTKSASSSGVRIGGKLVNGGGFSQLGININYEGYFCILNGISGSFWQLTSKVYKTPIDSKWHHFALVCKNGTVTLFLDGKKIYTTTRTIYSKIGNMTCLLCETGVFIDELRISNVARYENDFIPPTKPY